MITVYPNPTVKLAEGTEINTKDLDIFTTLNKVVKELKKNERTTGIND